MSNPTAKCFGWENSAHIGTEVLYSKDRGICIKQPDFFDYKVEDGGKIFGGFVHRRSVRHLKRDMVILINGLESGRHTVNPNWDYMYCWYKWSHKPPQTLIEFILVNTETDDIIYRREAIVNREEEEEKAVPDIKDLTDYNRIKEGVEKAVNESTGEIVDEILKAGVKIDSLEGEVTDLGVWLNEEVEKQNKAFVSGVAGIKEKITGLKIPTIEDIKNMFLSLAEEFANALWDKILDRIERRYEK